MNKKIISNLEAAVESARKEEMKVLTGEDQDKDPLHKRTLKIRKRSIRKKMAGKAKAVKKDDAPPPEDETEKEEETEVKEDDGAGGFDFSNDCTAEDISHAAWILEDALDGLHCSPYPRDEEGKALRNMTLHLVQAQHWFNWAVMLLTALIFIEPPLWCDNSRRPGSFMSSVERCPLPDGSQAELNGFFNFWPPLWCMFIEAVLLAVVTAALMYEKNLRDFAASIHVGGFRKHGVITLEVFVIVVFLLWVDLVVYAI